MLDLLLLFLSLLLARYGLDLNHNVVGSFEKIDRSILTKLKGLVESSSLERLIY